MAPSFSPTIESGAEVDADIDDNGVENSKGELVENSNKQSGMNEIFVALIGVALGMVILLAVLCIFYCKYHKLQQSPGSELDHISQSSVSCENDESRNESDIEGMFNENKVTDITTPYNTADAYMTSDKDKDVNSAIWHVQTDQGEENVRDASVSIDNTRDTANEEPTTRGVTHGMCDV